MGGCRAGVIPGFAIGVGGITVVFVDPDGVVGGLEDGGCWLCVWGSPLSSSVSPYVGGSALLDYICWGEVTFPIFWVDGVLESGLAASHQVSVAALSLLVPGLLFTGSSAILVEIMASDAAGVKEAVGVVAFGARVLVDPGLSDFLLARAPCWS